jgi:para-nitrobenzyl esterase
MKDNTREISGGLSRRDVMAWGVATAAVAAAAGAVADNTRSAGAGTVSSQGPKSPVVETDAGRIRGHRADDVYRFLGIPYGAPTGGPNRFMPPVKVSPWSGVRETLDYGAVSPQTRAGAPVEHNGALANMHAAPKAGETEDCLNLNLWTPAIDGGKRPVMVWLHGGGYFSGSGSMKVYDGARLSRAGDVVVVNVTHRLNVLGYTYLGELGGEEFGQSGNVGMLDIVMALEWVRTNIERFGGDPRRVMIFGESGGAGKVSTMLALPAAQGLFHQAAIQSGPAIFLPEAAASERVARALLAEFSWRPEDFRKLQTLPLADLMAGYFRCVAKLPAGPIAFSPVVDARVLPAHPCYPAAPAYSARIPVLIGSNQTESAFMWMGDPTVFKMDDAALRTRLARLLSGPEIDAAISLYRQHDSWATPPDLWNLINTDRSMRKNTLRYADSRAVQEGSRTWLYQLRWRTPYMNGQLRTPHFLDVPLIFRNHTLPGVSEFVGGGERADRMAKIMSDTWVAFAHSGSPQTAALPDWTSYDLPRRSTMILDETSRLESDPDADLRRFWETYDYQII